MSVRRRSDDSLFVAWRLCPFGRVRSPSSFKSSKAAQIKNPGSISDSAYFAAFGIRARTADRSVTRRPRCQASHWKRGRHCFRRNNWRVAVPDAHSYVFTDAARNRTSSLGSEKALPYLLGLLLLAGPDSNLVLERSVRLHIRHVPLRPSPSTSSEVSNSAPSSAAADGCVMGSFTCGAARRVQHGLVRRTWPCGHGLPSGYLDFAAVQRGAPNGRSHWRLPLAAGSTAPTSLLPV